jgi:ubiquinone/menaquinone biosynthesis C-methylase UbiE
VSFYQDAVLPWLTHLAMRQQRLVPYRTRVKSGAEGYVLEIGIGPRLNLPFYGAGVKQVIGLDPSPRLLEIADGAGRRSAIPVQLIEGAAEAIPLERESVATVVTTWTMCSIPDANRALSEVRRVLKRRGRLLFVEHGRAPEQSVQWWQDHLTPAWKRISGGCHLNRAIADIVRTNGFNIEKASCWLYAGAETDDRSGIWPRSFANTITYSRLLFGPSAGDINRPPSMKTTSPLDLIVNPHGPPVLLYSKASAPSQISPIQPNATISPAKPVAASATKNRSAPCMVMPQGHPASLSGGAH